MRSRFRNREIVLGAMAILHLRSRYYSENQDNGKIGMTNGEELAIPSGSAVARGLSMIDYVAFGTSSQSTVGFIQGLENDEE